MSLFYHYAKEHIDYDLVESTNPAFNKAIVRVNIFKQHRQTIQVVIITVEFPVIVINILVYAILDFMVSLNSF